MQAFKENDPIEEKVKQCFLSILNLIGEDEDAFFNGAYTAFPLGDVLYTLHANPLTRILSQDTFRKSFDAINEFFTKPGTFEFYLDIFRTIFGESVVVEFTIPGDGQLQIDIEAIELETGKLIARRIVADAYVYDNLVDQDGDYILNQGVTGITTQEDLDILMKELAVAGVFTEATLTLS